MPFLPVDDESEYTLIPDLVVMDVAYMYTGLRDGNGHKILRRVSRPVGFVHHSKGPEYAIEHDERIERAELDQGDDLEGE